jgi:hypothetical protein
MILLRLDVDYAPRVSAVACIGSITDTVFSLEFLFCIDRVVMRLHDVQGECNFGSRLCIRNPTVPLDRILNRRRIVAQRIMQRLELLLSKEDIVAASREGRSLKISNRNVWCNRRSHREMHKIDLAGQLESESKLPICKAKLPVKPSQQGFWPSYKTLDPRHCRGRGPFYSTSRRDADAPSFSPPPHLHRSPQQDRLDTALATSSSRLQTSDKPVCDVLNVTFAKMSVTTTANPITYNLQTVLADYDLHHTEEELDTSLNAHPAPNTSQANPSSWPTEHRRVPEFRPINRELDQSERRVFQNGIEQVFVGVMFTGVFLESVSTNIEGSVNAADVSF